MPILKGTGNTLLRSRFRLRQTDLNPRQSRCVLPPVYPQQLAHQLGLGGNGLMDALGLSFKKFSLE